MARQCVDMGFYISFAGPLTYPKNDALREVAHTLPIDVMLVETDSPYLTPQPWRGKRNEPAYVAKTAQVGAEVFGMDYADFAAQTTANFERLFWKAAR